MGIVDIGHIERYMKARRVWGHFYRASSYARSTLWMVPFVAIVLVLAITPALRALDDATHWQFVGLNLAGATALYQTVITLTLSFLVFTFGSLLVAIQVAGGQLTPRIIATTLLRDNVVRYSVGLFVFTLRVRGHGARTASDDSGARSSSRSSPRLLGRRLHRRLPVPHRLRGAPAAPGEHRRARRRTRASR